MLAHMMAALAGLIIFAGTPFAEAGCMPCGNQGKFCCNDENCRKCEAEDNSSINWGLSPFPRKFAMTTAL